MLNEEVYVEAPKGYELPDDKVYLIMQSIYGLLQSRRCWYDRFSKTLAEAGLVRFKSDPSVYTRKEGNNYIHVGIYLENFLVVTSIKEMKDKLMGNVKKNIEVNETTE